MTLKMIATTLVLSTLPALSYAMCSDKEHQAQSCAPGTVWDTDSQTCVSQINS